MYPWSPLVTSAYQKHGQDLVRNKHLHFFHEEVKDKNEYQINNEYFNEEKNIIDKKYYDYKNNKNIQTKVQEYITKIYNNKRNETLKIYQELLNENEKNLIEGY